MKKFLLSMTAAYIILGSAVYLAATRAQARELLNDSVAHSGQICWMAK